MGRSAKRWPQSDDDCDEVLTNFAKAGINVDALGEQLQVAGGRIVRQLLE